MLDWAMRLTNARVKGLAGLKSLNYLDLRGNSKLTESGYQYTRLAVFLTHRPCVQFEQKMTTNDLITAADRANVADYAIPRGMTKFTLDTAGIFIGRARNQRPFRTIRPIGMRTVPSEVHDVTILVEGFHLTPRISEACFARRS
jgi:hypothetical protein